jgi:glycosyltransferase involved in cell wall biosynthesis
LGNRILVIIPALHEEKKIGAVIREIRQERPDVSILVINDASRDKTESEAKMAGAMVINHTVNRGYGQALQTGYRFALLNHFDYVVQMDGDGQHNPIYMTGLLWEVENRADMVIGSRFIGDDPGYHIPFFRLIGMKFFSFLLNRVCGTKFTDTTSGFRGFNERALQFCVSPEFPKDYPDANAIKKMKLAGLKIIESPVKMRLADGKKSMHSGLKPIKYSFKMIAELLMN